MSKDSRKAHLRAVADLLRTAKTRDELVAVLEDWLTPAEAADLVERWRIVKLLLEGKSQREVNRLTGISIATITRAAHVINAGAPGFRLLHDRSGSSKS